jgi:hypothetical protein
METSPEQMTGGKVTMSLTPTAPTWGEVLGQSAKCITFARTSEQEVDPTSGLIESTEFVLYFVENMKRAGYTLIA